MTTETVFLVEVTKGRLSANVFDDNFNIVMEEGTDINQAGYTRPKEVNYRKGDQLYLPQRLIDGPFKGCVRKVMQPVEYVPVEKPIIKEKKIPEVDKDQKKKDGETGPEEVDGKDKPPAKTLTAAEKRQAKADKAEADKAEADQLKAGQAEADKAATLAGAIPKQ